MIIKYLIQVIIVITHLKKRVPNRLTGWITKIVDVIYYKPLKTLEKAVVRKVPRLKELLTWMIKIMEKYVKVKAVNKCKLIPRLILITIFIYESQCTYILKYYYYLLILIVIPMLIDAILYIVRININNTMD